MFRWEIFDSDAFGITILRSLAPQVLGKVADMGLDRVRAWGQRGAVALRAVVEEVEGATVGSGVEVAEAVEVVEVVEVAEVTVRRGAVVVVEEEEARIPQGEVVVEVQDIARTSYVATCRAFPVDEIFLRKCVVSVSFRFVIGFLNSFDFGGGFSFGGVVVTVAKRPFPYLSISFSTFFQRSSCTKRKDASFSSLIRRIRRCAGFLF